MRAQVPALPVPVPVLRGERLILRGLDERDVDALFELHADARVMRHWSFARWTRRADAVAHVERIARECAALEMYAWAATLAADDRLVGTCTLFNVHRERRRGVVSYALMPALWGRGLARDMLGLALDHAFDGLGLERIEADIHADNQASCRLAERLGFVREGVLHERWNADGSPAETMLYTLSRTRCRTRPCLSKAPHPA